MPVLLLLTCTMRTATACFSPQCPGRPSARGRCPSPPPQRSAARATRPVRTPHPPAAHTCRQRTHRVLHLIDRSGRDERSKTQQSMPDAWIQLGPNSVPSFLSICQAASDGQQHFTAMPSASAFPTTFVLSWRLHTLLGCDSAPRPGRQHPSFRKTCKTRLASNTRPACTLTAC